VDLPPTTCNLLETESGRHNCRYACLSLFDCRTRNEGSLQRVAHAMGQGVSSVECRLRVEEIRHDVRRTGAWAPEEDEQLLAAVAAHGKTWWKVRLQRVMGNRSTDHSICAMILELQVPTPNPYWTCRLAKSPTPHRDTLLPARTSQMDGPHVFVNAL
jgi:hypothetical protein